MNSPGTLLFVEDEESVLKIFKFELERKGYTVLVAKSAQEALLKCQRHIGPIHVLLADIFLPKDFQVVGGRIQELAMNGLQLASRVQAYRPYIRTLFISGHSREDINALGGLPPGAQFLQKPFEVHDLLR
ncbi:MAG: response regulator, partial [Nitrospirales bacterium]